MTPEIKTGSSSYMLLYERAAIVKPEFDDLLEKLEETMQRVQKIFQELTALLSSGTPPSPQKVAALLGKMEALMEESNRLREQADGLATKMEFAGLYDAFKLMKPLETTVNQDLKRQLSEKIADKPKQLEISELSSQVSKDSLKAIEELAQMTVTKGSMNEADVEQLLTTLSQLSDSISKAREALRERL